MKKPKIQQRIKELHAENMNRNNLTVDKVLADLEHDRIMARQSGKYLVAKDCSIAQGKYLAMLTDNINQRGDGLHLNVITTQEPEKAEEKKDQCLPCENVGRGYGGRGLRSVFEKGTT